MGAARRRGSTIEALTTVALTVASIRRATPQTRILRLVPGGRPLEYRAGQAMLLRVPAWPEPVPYSIASSPEETSRDGYIEFLIKLEDDGTWPAHLQGIRRGGAVEVQGPVGRFVFPPDPPETQFLFVAGGTGIAPLRSMIVHVLLQQRPGARLHLMYSARTPQDFAYLPELRRYAREGRLELALNVTRAEPRLWRGRRGRITEGQLAPLVEAPDTLCFVCGPAPMVDEVPRMLERLGVNRRHIRMEEW